MSGLGRLLESWRLLAAVWGATLILVVGGFAGLAYFMPETPQAPAKPHARHQAQAPAMPAHPAGQPGPAAGAAGDHPAEAEARVEDESPQPAAEEPAAKETEATVAAQREAPAALRVVVAEAPDPDLLEPSPYGPLPVRAADGRTPFKAYQRPFVVDAKRPRIAILVTHLGLSEARTEEAIAELLPAVSLAFSPYGRRLEDWGRKARRAGHEVLMMVPMEPVGYPDDDPGALGLMTRLQPAENIDRLHRVLARMTAYVGIVSEMGSRFTAAPLALAPVIADLSRRGLLVVDARATARSLLADAAGKAGLPVAVNDRNIDNIADPAEIDRYLRELETLALRRGYALGMARPYPVTIARIRAWAENLGERGFVLAPVSAVAVAPGEGR